MQAPSMAVLDAGKADHRAKQPGSIVAFNYKLTAPTLEGAVLEAGKGAKFQFGRGAVAPEVCKRIVDKGTFLLLRSPSVLGMETK
jgi:hypothetical protein